MATPPDWRSGSVPPAKAVDIEEPEADVIEQRHPVEPDKDPQDEPYAEPIPVEADPADAAEQRLSVGFDDDYPPAE